MRQILDTGRHWSKGQLLWILYRDDADQALKRAAEAA